MKEHNLNLIGHQFNRWTILSPAPTVFQSQLRWNCVCQCGTERIVYERSLLNGASKSCGCYRDEWAAQQAVEGTTAVIRTHGLAKTPEHNIWCGIKRRCDQTLRDYTGRKKDYAERGITICDRWANSFEAFLADMGSRPSDRHSIERINNCLGYSPENCRWATYEEQGRNKRNNRLLTHNGETKTMTDWSRDTGIAVSTIWARLQMGWSDSDALTRPLRHTSRNRSLRTPGQMTSAAK